MHQQDKSQHDINAQKMNEPIFELAKLREVTHKVIDDKMPLGLLQIKTLKSDICKSTTPDALALKDVPSRLGDQLNDRRCKRRPPGPVALILLARIQQPIAS